MHKLLRRLLGVKSDSRRCQTPRISRTGTAGFSTLEVLIATAMLTTVIGTVSALVMSLQKGHIAEQDISEVQQNQRYAMDSILRAVRGAGNDPNGIGVVRFDLDPNGNGQYDDLRVRSDFNLPDGDTSDADEVVTFSLASNVLSMTDAATGAVSELAQNISAISFEYFDSAGSASTDPASIVKVRVTITGVTARRDPRTGEYRTITLTDEGIVRSSI